MARKKSLISLPIIFSSTLIVGASGAFITTLFIKDENIWYKQNIEEVKVTNSEFIKGADISSYAEIIEQSTYENCQYTKYQDLTDDDAKIYTDFDGQKKNLFEILRNNGVNSLRLRVWNDPYTADGESYGGGHNDIETNIWITNQAKKFGFDDFLLNFHFSDFWADPNRQWLPKAWQELTDEQINTEVQTYTYNALKKYYDQTGITPKIIQLGNEITYGAFWRPENDKNSENKNILRTAGFLNHAALGVSDFKNYVKSLTRKTPDINLAIHLDGTPSVERFVKILQDYLIIGNNIAWVNQIGITHYQNWNGNNIKLYKLMKKIKDEFNLDSYVSEAATAYTKRETGYVGDISSSQTKSYEQDFITNNQMHTKLLTSLMQTVNKVLPKSRTGFYWWEPAWIMTGKNGWANKNGIMYAEPNNVENQETFMTGNSWWNRGWFDLHGKALPILKFLNTFKRQYQAIDLIDINNLETQFYSQTFKTDIIFKRAPIVDNLNFLEEAEDLSKRISTTYFKIYQTSNLKETVTSEFLNANEGIFTSQVEFKNFTYDAETKKGTMELSLGTKNFYYAKNFTNQIIYFDVKTLTDQTLDFTSETLNISSTNWYKSLFQQFNQHSDWKDELKTKLESTITAEFDKDWWYSVWFDEATGIPGYWGKDNNVNRGYRAWLAKPDAIRNIFTDDSTVEYDTLNEISNWEESLAPNRTEVILYLTKDVDFDKYGIENWKNLKTVGIKFKINYKTT